MAERIAKRKNIVKGSALLVAAGLAVAGCSESGGHDAAKPAPKVSASHPRHHTPAQPAPGVPAPVPKKEHMDTIRPFSFSYFTDGPKYETIVTNNLIAQVDGEWRQLFKKDEMVVSFCRQNKLVEGITLHRPERQAKALYKSMGAVAGDGAHIVIDKYAAVCADNQKLDKSEVSAVNQLVGNMLAEGFIAYYQDNPAQLPKPPQTSNDIPI